MTRTRKPAPTITAALEPRVVGYEGTHDRNARAWGDVTEGRKSYRVAVYQTGMDWRRNVTLEVTVYDASGRMLPETHKPAIRAAALEAYRATYHTPEAIEASRTYHASKIVARMDWEGLQALAAGTHPDYTSTRLQEAAKARIAELKATPALETAAPVLDPSPLVQAVVICPLEDGESEIFGPFTGGDAATRWGFDNLKGRKWHWEAMRAPSSISA